MTALVASTEEPKKVLKHVAGLCIVLREDLASTVAVSTQRRHGLELLELLALRSWLDFGIFVDLGTILVHACVV